MELSGNGNKWVNHKYNFDNLGQALMSLFVLSSKDGWVNIMYSGLDAVGIDQQVRFVDWTLYHLTILLLYIGNDYPFYLISLSLIFSQDRISMNGD